MVKRLRKLKLGLRYYAANYKNDQDSNITAKELQLVSQIILLLKPFFEAKKCTGLPRDWEKSGKIKKMTKVR